jgi:hypothetical protein
MKQSHLFVYALFIVLSLGVSLTACRDKSGASDTQTTIDAAVAATANAQQAIQATIAAGVAATDTAQATPPAEEAVATPVVISQTINATTSQTTTVRATPTAPQDYSTLSEEELVALIEQAVAQAAAVTTQYSTAAVNATADDTVTPEEAQTVEVYVNTAKEAVNTAEQAMAAYYELYYDLALARISHIKN